MHRLQLYGYAVVLFGVVFQVVDEVLELHAVVTASQTALQDSTAQVPEVLDDVLLHELCGLLQWVLIIAKAVHHLSDLILEPVAVLVRDLVALLGLTEQCLVLLGVTHHVLVLRHVEVFIRNVRELPLWFLVTGPQFVLWSWRILLWDRPVATRSVSLLLALFWAALLLRPTCLTLIFFCPWRVLLVDVAVRLLVSLRILGFSICESLPLFFIECSGLAAIALLAGLHN